jgi:ribose transport system permease protein
MRSHGPSLRRIEFGASRANARAGGIGSIIGSVVGTLISTVLRTGLIIGGINPFWQQVVMGAILIVAVFIDQRRRKATEWM